MDAELRKIDIARILTGLFALIRFWQIVGASVLIGGWSDSHESLAIATLVSAVLVIIGFLTTFASASLAILMRLCDNAYSTNTLGTTVFIQLLIVFVLLRAGRNYSIDSLLVKRSKLLQRFYGQVSDREMKSAYAFALIVYGSISAAALWFHVKDPYWIHGLTVKSMFTNSYLCKHYDLFRAIDDRYPVALGILSISSGIAQTVFQFLMLPLMLFRYGRFFVRWHGTFFFLISFFLLNLSFLPHFELLLWWVILYPNKIPAGKEIQASIWDGQASLGAIATGFYLVYLVIGISFLTTIRWTTFSNEDQGVPSPLRADAIYVSRMFGLEVPIVFDSADLEMGNRWVLLYRETGGEVLTPITGLDGQRLNYFGHDVLGATNHNSDALYFGTTLPCRRRMIDFSPQEVASFLDQGRGHNFLARQIAYDYRYESLSGPATYKVVVMENDAAEVKLFQASPERLTPEPVYTRSLTFDGKHFVSGRA